jgi:hypothetical protein
MTLRIKDYYSTVRYCTVHCATGASSNVVVNRSKPTWKKQEHTTRNLVRRRLGPYVSTRWAGSRLNHHHIIIPIFIINYCWTCYDDDDVEHYTNN